ncbi:MAG: trypsin-like serine protease [Sandaracinaceae bacterium]|nr:trypsin-like serine protease [Sandaracinaceae bacterium]
MRWSAVVFLFLLGACEGLISLDVPQPDRPPGPPPSIFVDGGRPPPGVDGGECDVGDHRPSAVFHGTTEPTLLSMTNGQKLAVVMYRTGGGVCSGTIIADRWVLTAKHCNPSGGTTGSVHFGRDPDNPDIAIDVARVLRHPGRDLILLELSESVHGRLADVSFIPYFTGPIDSSWSGRTVECAGYGTQEDGTLGERRFTAEPISGVDGTYITVDGEGRHGLCGGDSGGPIFYQDTAGQIFVLGALTGGDTSCVGEDNYTRVDPAWVLENVGPTDPPDPPADPCMGLDARGRCDGSTAEWCEGGALQRMDCVGDTTCRDGADGYRCRGPDPSPGDPCDGLTMQGRCTADGTAEWCEGGIIRRAYCTRCGLACRPITALGGVWCEEAGIPP